MTYVSNIYKYYIAYRLIMDSKPESSQTIEQMKGASQTAHLPCRR